MYRSCTLLGEERQIHGESDVVMKMGGEGRWLLCCNEGRKKEEQDESIKINPNNSWKMAEYSLL